MKNGSCKLQVASCSCFGKGSTCNIMSISNEGIETADNLWFGQNGVARDRDAAVSLFRSLAHSGGAVSEDSGYSSGNDDSEPCKSGLCCNHRRNANNGSNIIAEASNNISSQKSILCVGAGPSGLVTLKELRSHGIANVKCYEGSSDIGGAFSKAYDDAVMTSSNLLTAFSSYPLSEYHKELHGNGVDNKAEMWTNIVTMCNEVYAVAVQPRRRPFIGCKIDKSGQDSRP